MQILLEFVPRLRRVDVTYTTMFSMQFRRWHHRHIEWTCIMEVLHKKKTFGFPPLKLSNQLIYCLICFYYFSVSFKSDHRVVLELEYSLLQSSLISQLFGTALPCFSVSCGPIWIIFRETSSSRSPGPF